jgi:hypothetical protein
MLIAIASGVIMLAFLDRAMRLERIATVQLKAKFELYAIRDDLRRAERQRVVPGGRWFSYMDTTLTKAAASIERLTVWHALAYLRVSDFSMMQEAERNRATAMEEFPELAALHRRYAECVARLVRERHALLWSIMRVVAHLFVAFVVWRARVLTALQGSPQTSTLLVYARRA